MDKKSSEHNMLVNQAGVLLKACGVPRMPVTEFPHDANKPFTSYFYSQKTSLQIIDFFQDHIDYILRVREQASNRRVVFLLTANPEEIVAVYVQYENVNHDKLTFLLRSLDESNKLNLSGEMLDAMKNLYQHVTACVLQPGEREDLSPHFINHAFPQATVSRQPFYLDNSFEILAECLLQLLQHGTVSSFEVERIHAKFQTVCADTLKKFVESLSESNPDHHKKISKLLRIVTKYTGVMFSRSEYNVDNAWLGELEDIQQKDALVKKFLYLSTDDTSKFFSLTTLIQLVRHETSGELLQWLKESREVMLTAIKDWETQLQQKIAEQKKSWKINFAALVKKSGEFIYRHSFVGLSASVSRIVTKRLISKNDYALLASQGVGGLVGLGYTYFSGVYSFVRMLLISLCGNALDETMSQAAVNDRKATAASAQLDAMGILNFVSIASILFSGVETIYFKDPSLFVRAVSGTGLSYIFVAATKRLFPAVNTIHLSEEQMLLLFFVSLAGHEAGARTVGFVNDWLSPENLVENSQPKPIVCDWSASFWAKSNDETRTACTQRTGLFGDQAYCEDPLSVMPAKAGTQ